MTIRTRLTLWYTAVLMAVLVLFGVWVYVGESRLRIANLDLELARAAKSVATAVGAEMEEGSELADAAPEAYKDFVAVGRVVSIRDAHGARLAGGGGRLPEIPASGRQPESVATLRGQGQDWRVYARRDRHGDVAYEVIVAILRRTLLVGIPLALALAAAGGWWIARRALHPVGLMVAQAGRITGHAAGYRLQVPHPHDELGVLARAFNELLDRMEGVLRGQRQFMADASHELRTPVSIARTTAEVTLTRPTRSEQEYRDALAVVAGQTARLARIVHDMMILARADAGGLTLERADLYLDELVSACVGEAALLARESRIEVRARPAPETALRGDERLLRQMLMNLLDNAIRHTPAGGQVDAAVHAAAGHVEISVVDTGGGVPISERDRIFERFVRLDPSRQRPGGAGLGLPIARCIAEAHGGTLTLAESTPAGSRFLVSLPRAGA
jgi:heavy metal sensor kinase